MSFCSVIPSTLMSNRVHSLLYETFGASKTDPALVGQQFAHSADTPAAKVVNVIERAFAPSQIDQILDRCDKVFVGQDALGRIDVNPESF